MWQEMQMNSDGVADVELKSAADADVETVELWTDGACKGNPGPGGWGVLMRAGAHEKTLHGGELETTAWS
jgi:ribonuclease HI